MRTLFASSLVVAQLALAQPVVPWFAETSPVPSILAGDPAVVAEGPAPLVLGTDRGQNGVYAWLLDGGLPVQVVPSGIVRAVDWEPGLVVVTGANGQLLFFRVTPQGLEALDPPSSSVASPGHVALHRRGFGSYEVFVDTSSPGIERFSLSLVDDGGVVVTPRLGFTLPETPSGFDVDRFGRVFAALPTRGLYWLQEDGGLQRLVAIEDGTLGTQVGALELFQAADGGSVFFSTSPADDQVRLHAWSGGATATSLGAFEVGAPDGGAARARQPRALDVYERSLPGFPLGVLAVQDQFGGNYKLVDLAAVDAVIDLPPSLGAGGLDAGVRPDAGAPDAGSDGGSAVGIGVGGGSGSGGSPAPGTQPPIDEPGCGCTGGPFALLPALLLLWWSRRPRS